jgi:hypothetical protein
MQSDGTSLAGEIRVSAPARERIADSSRRDALLLSLVGAQALAFVAAAASGNIPSGVLLLFRALLTL